MVIVACVAFLSVACRREAEAPPVEDQAAAQEQTHPQRLVFPTEFRVEDPTVNTFVEEAMASCASGDYDRFRLLWTAREEPLPRAEYEEGWQAVQQIRVRAVEKVALARKTPRDPNAHEMAYVVLADVFLDPAHPAGQKEPRREAVLMMVRERDHWRLARATKAMRSWIKEHRRDRPGPRNDAPPPRAENEKP